MKLFHSPSSPFVRKVMACALLRGLENRIELIPTNPHTSPEGLLAMNPLSKVPCLVTDEGQAIFDSPVICEYLDGLGDSASLYPQGAARIAAKTMEALADGIMDAAVARRMSMGLAQDEGRTAFQSRQQDIVARSLDALEKAPPKGLADIGAVAVACAIGYLDFRFGHEPWREAHPKLAAWYEEVSAHPALSRTAPPPA
ncbi:glutathione S-transferase N-terminal domain-containing protein [Roseomonas sp. E05]|uniref:glutathione S-transferase N-terminal domain-containing protein n=1 Tax=Roseomonas sp. E05 TaxID=3046310 RepID=UPI0024BA480D|nr:glutathione S-transferase N-terminal domain-containing protein [Roseomonas sp. E05]MDJ0386688.1 glutathione S-transferase N-terminal domain-containing protein [Roseomonas sp. E05]